MDISTVSLADLATRTAGATRVFHKHGLDFCCRGRRTLLEACRERGLDAALIAVEIETEERPAEDLVVWSERPLAHLIGFIESNYHAGLRRELPELIALAAKVETRHADKTTCPAGLSAHLRDMHQAVLAHLEKEECILFPMILAGATDAASAPIQMMEREHEDHGASLARLRALTNDLTLPPEACTSWKALYLRLGVLESDLMDHIHLENNVLFPRVLGS